MNEIPAAAVGDEYESHLDLRVTISVGESMGSVLPAGIPFLAPTDVKWRERMDEIPEDAMTAARAHCPQLEYGDQDRLYPAVVGAIARAIVAERERVAAAIQGQIDNPASHDPAICLDMALRAVAPS